MRKRLADGTVKEYHYPKKRNVTTNPDTSLGTVGHVLTLYYISPEFTRIRPVTRSNRRLYLREMEKMAEKPIRDITRKMLIEIRDSIAYGRGPGAANGFLAITKTFFGWALDREWVDINPAMAIPLLPRGSLPAWTKEAVQNAEKTLDPALWRVVVLGVFTGQRRSDLCRMQWSDVKNGFIYVRQQKTGTELRIPIHPILASKLEEWRGDSPYILTTHTDAPWKPVVLTTAMCRAAKQGKIPKGFNVHGLRKLAATLLAEAGCTTHEIASITGHKTLAMVQHYTLSADQERLAKGAVSRMETSFWKPQENDG
ncbi:tyrosine-type recombinase/integrase [Komagataeibacter saccharivorans]|uniref:tyrosine-type recombinase/integrase n=1 Tax=Komagataeibacter saccharivorans TaxID=265959 RepID=UPI0039E897C7